MKMFDGDIQRIPKRTICCAFWNIYPAGYLASKRKSSSDKAGIITSFTSSRPLSLGDDEASSEFTLKMTSVQNLVTLEYEVAFS
jgi:hypothetical protein